jgi:hypothetical protein
MKNPLLGIFNFGVLKSLFDEVFNNDFSDTKFFNDLKSDINQTKFQNCLTKLNETGDTINIDINGIEYYMGVVGVENTVNK